MKRLILLAALCAFVLGAATAQAADIKASGDWVVEGNWNSNWDFDSDVTGAAEDSSFEISQRATTTFEFIANENLKGVLVTRYGTEEWGTNSFAIGDGDSNTQGNNRILVRRAYIDFNWPDTTVAVRAGYQGVTLPNAFGGGSLIMSEEVGAITVSGEITDNVSYLLGYARAYSEESTETQANVDGYVAALPLTFDGFTLTPFGMYAPIGQNFDAADLIGTNAADRMVGLAALNASDTHTGNDATFDNAYWLGAAFTMDLFDPFVLKADFNYGKVASEASQNERAGYLFDLALEYKGFDFMTPEAFFVYTSGEDGNASEGDGSSERMPMLAAGDWTMGSFFFGGDRLLAGSIASRNNYMGFWALGLSLKDIQSFADGLTHDAHIIYAQGTNDEDTAKVGAAAGTTNNYNTAYGRTLTEKDSLWEVDFNTGYKLYDELTLSLDLGYVNLDTAKERWYDQAAAVNGQKGGDAWKVSTGIAYSF